MKRSKKLGLLAVAAVGGAIAISGCTANFCRNDEKCRMIFAIEPGVSRYYESEEKALEAFNEHKGDQENWSYTITKVGSNDNLYRLVEKNGSGEFTKSNQLTAINNAAKSKGIYIPSDEYFVALDQKVLEIAVSKAELDINTVTCLQVNGGEKLPDDTVSKGILAQYGYNKLSMNNDDLWSNYDLLNAQIKLDLGLEKCPTIDYVNLYKSTMEQAVNNMRSCIATVTGEYGNYGQESTTITIEKKTWKYAWSRGGAVIEGLIVYPVAWLVDQFAYMFAGGNNATAGQIHEKYLTGVPQILSLLVVTIIVRLFIFGASFKTTLDQQKMQRLQPELAKIQAKYPNSNTNQAEKQRMAEEQMKLYKKNKVNPLSQLLILVIQFPIFIGVWGAMTGSAVLSTGKFLQLDLSTSIWTALTTKANLFKAGWWTAIVLFLLMAISQFFAMKVPQWIQKARTKKVARLGKNPAQTQQNRTMTIFSYVMLIMIIVMGFTLPAAMGFYWFVGALFSLAQTLFTQLIINRKRK